MKLKILFLSAISFCCLSSSLLGKNIQLHLSENQELVYEYTNQRIKKIDNLYLRKDINTIKFSISVNKIVNETVFFTARLISDNTLSSSGNNTGFYDAGFPQLINSVVIHGRNKIGTEVLYQIPFDFEMNLNSGNHKLTNRIDILEQCHSLLNEKGYNVELRNSIILDINKTKIQQQIEIFLMPFLFLSADVDQVQTPIEKLNLHFSSKIDEKGRIHFISTSDSASRKIECTVNRENGFAEKYNELSIKDQNKRNLSRHKNEERTVIELLLKQNKLKKSNKLIVCGHLQNPVSKKVTVYTLNNEFGTELDNQTALLDESGNFRIETLLKSQGLVILVNPNNNRFIEGAHLLLYAEPGDSLFLDVRFQTKKFNLSHYVVIDSLKTKIEEFIVPAELSFSGDRKAEAELLSKFQWQNGFVPLKIVNNSLFPDRYANDALNYLDVLSKLDALILDNQKNIESGTRRFLKNELQAFLLSQICTKIPPVIMNSGFLISSLEQSIPQSARNKVSTIFDTLKVHNAFNDYGCFSRKFNKDYVGYKFRSISPIGNDPIGYAYFGYFPDFEQYFHFTKSVLYGSALYREGARQLYDYSIRTSRFRKENDFQPFVDETIDLMIKRCNDKCFVEALKSIRKAQGKWDDPLFLPDIKFLNLKREETNLQSFLNQKPVIIFSSQEWSGSRYEMDEFATKYNDITFILLNDGSNFDFWKEWNDRAAPVANQLFLKNDSTNLEAVFQKNILKYLIYSPTGERIGIENNLEKAVLIAQKSMNPPPKQLNKSTMMGIIWFLGGTLFLLLTGFLIFKIRMKRRLKKQEQEKRLQELQLSAIRAQMNPHFLFNSLNSVQNLIQKDRAHEAHLYLADFAGLIRKVLNNSQREEISLAEELETLNQYIQLEKLRFDFEFEMHVDSEIDGNNFMVPSMILQPIAENALTHGLQHKQGDKKLTVTVVKSDTDILISIEDNGIGFDAARKLKTGSNGVGLKMNEERLRIMDEKYGGKYSFRIIDLFERGSEGTRVEINIPDEI